MRALQRAAHLLGARAVVPDVRGLAVLAVQELAEVLVLAPGCLKIEDEVLDAQA